MAENTFIELIESNKQLRKERNRLNLSLAENVGRLRDLNNTINHNNEMIKEFYNAIRKLIK